MALTDTLTTSTRRPALTQPANCVLFHVRFLWCIIRASNINLFLPDRDAHFTPSWCSFWCLLYLGFVFCYFRTYEGWYAHAPCLNSEFDRLTCIFYNPFTLREPRSPTILNEERGFLRVNRLYTWCHIWISVVRLDDAFQSTYSISYQQQR